MPKLIKQPQKQSKPTVIKPITRQCNGCFEEKTTARRHCNCTYTTCNACVKGWIVGDGGIIDTTGKFVYTCPQCRRHLAIPPSMLHDADVNQKLANLLEETEDSEEDEPEETEIIFAAIDTGNDEMVRQFLWQDPDLVNYRSSVSDILVSHYIASRGSEELQKEIFAHPKRM
jgi:hypothetical protein